LNTLILPSAKLFQLYEITANQITFLGSAHVNPFPVPESHFRRLTHRLGLQRCSEATGGLSKFFVHLELIARSRDIETLVFEFGVVVIWVVLELIVFHDICVLVLGLAFGEVAGGGAGGQLLESQP
jgi:hypothetical protein